MKELKDMNLEELLEYDKNHYVPYMELFISNKDILNLHKCNKEFDMKKFLFLKLKYFHINKIPLKYYSDYVEYRKSLPINKEIDRIYNSLLDDLVKLINSLNIEKDPLTITLLFNLIVIPRGYLSYGDNFSIVKDNNLEEFTSNYGVYSSFGMAIFCGYGCCRHMVSFMADLFDKLGIKCDRISCLTENINNYNMEDINFSCNHAVLGYINKDKYHIIDPTRSLYFIEKYDNYYFSPDSLEIIIPDFSVTLLQEKYSFNLDMEYKTNDEKDLSFALVNVSKIIKDKSFSDTFINFKNDHIELYEKLAYLVPLEFGRNEEKEDQKLKIFKQNQN